jgi:acyl-[acyl-carrier-protein]-phospholipid O-acyltransferase/long-chain-fatty-acid--[acyl-carrier-protein] ligase
MSHQLSQTLKSKTFVGLLLAQFTATFNDQAVHMVAVFYAVDMLVRFVEVKWLDEKGVVSIVTACFIAPFLMFSSFAGPLGDKYSKRSVIVFWKLAEVLMMGLALLGLLLPHLVGVDSAHIRTAAAWSAILVIASVFLMGMHSTFFVPAKLGAMPEILHPSILSRGNGMLEGTSFTAQILGTSFGGILYSLLKGSVIPGQPPQLVTGSEWLIGVMLLALALLGTITAALMHRIPAAAPDLVISWNWWRPMQQNLGIVWRSKPLTLSVTGIAFCVFMTLFLRQTLLLQGEITKELKTARAAAAVEEGSPSTELDQWLKSWLPERLAHLVEEPELRVALLFALVGLGVGLGSVAAGYLSGHRVELGLVPIGALVITAFTFIPSAARSTAALVFSLFAIGCGAGFYLVPLYTLLQHRAPKKSKGNVVSASNFLNVSGGIVAVAAFFAVSSLLDATLGAGRLPEGGQHNPALLAAHLEELEGQTRIPRLLFLTASACTVGAVALLLRRLPDFLLRSAIWLRSGGINRLRVGGLEHMPLDGPVVLVTNCGNFAAALDLVAAVDRYPTVMLIESPAKRRGSAVLRALARRAGMRFFEVPSLDSQEESIRALGRQTLACGGMVAINVDGQFMSCERLDAVLGTWRELPGTVVLPVRWSAAHKRGDPGGKHPAGIHFGDPLDGAVDGRGAIAAIEALDGTAAGH